MNMNDESAARIVDYGITPLLVTVQDACKLLGCGKTKVFAMINEGLLERRKLGHATRVTFSSIRRVAGEAR